MEARLQIVDERKGGLGHITIDQIMLADAPARSSSEPALWFDYGKDCYAAVSWSDVPTSPWRSAMIIPREVGLRRTTEGIRLVQSPVRELAQLRKEHLTFEGGDIPAANHWLAKHRIQGGQLEIIVDLSPVNSGIQGLKIFKSQNEETVIGVDRDNGRVFVDRTQSGNVRFHPLFELLSRFSSPLCEKKLTTAPS